MLLLKTTVVVFILSLALNGCVRTDDNREQVFVRVFGLKPPAGVTVERASSEMVVRFGVDEERFAIELRGSAPVLHDLLERRKASTRITESGLPLPLLFRLAQSDPLAPTLLDNAPRWFSGEKLSPRKQSIVGNSMVLEYETPSGAVLELWFLQEGDERVFIDSRQGYMRLVYASPWEKLEWLDANVGLP